jgi:chromosome segregation ATPase
MDDADPQLMSREEMERELAAILKDIGELKEKAQEVLERLETEKGKYMEIRSKLSTGALKFKSDKERKQFYKKEIERLVGEEAGLERELGKEEKKVDKLKRDLETKHGDLQGLE